MSWEHFFGVWTAACGSASCCSFIAISLAAGKYRTKFDNTFDPRLWLIPGVLALLTAVFGSVTALTAK
jgi:hypothetical protein